MLGGVRIATVARVVLAALAVVPFGGLGAFREQMVTGDIADSVDQGRFLIARYDDNGRISYQVAALKNKPPKGGQVYLLGGSAVREWTTSDEELAGAIERRCGRSVRALTLASSMQGFANALAIIDNLPVARRGGVVVIGFHQASFADSQSDARAQLSGVPLLMESPALREFFAEHGGGKPSGNVATGLRKYLASYLDKRGVPAFRGRPVEYLQHRYDVRGPLSLAAKQAKVTQFKSNLGAPNGPFFTYFDLNAALLRRCAMLARSKGYEVLLMENPQDAAAVGSAYDVYKQKYRPFCRRLVRKQAAHYVNLNTRVALHDTDFYDLAHLLRSGSTKWTPALTATIAGIIEDHQPEKTSSPSPSPSAARPGGDEPEGRPDRVASDESAAPSENAEGLALWRRLALVLVTAAALLPPLARYRALRRPPSLRGRRAGIGRGSPADPSAGGSRRRPPRRSRSPLPTLFLLGALALVGAVFITVVVALVAGGGVGFGGLLWRTLVAAAVLDVVSLVMMAGVRERHGGV